MQRCKNILWMIKLLIINTQWMIIFFIILPHPNPLQNGEGEIGTPRQSLEELFD